MPLPTIYLDECVNHYATRFLVRRGVSLVTAQAAGMSGADDEDQLRYATANGWLLLTTNMQHFIRLHTIFRTYEWAHSGIVTVPESPIFDRLAFRCAMMLDWIASEFLDQHNRLFRWTDLQQRLISGYVLEGYTTEEISLALGRSP
jgi:hypothetical protein